MTFLETLYAPNYQSLADRLHIFRLLNVYMALITLFADLKSLGRTLNHKCKRTMKLIGILSAPARDGSALTPEDVPASRPASRPASSPASRPASQDPIISTGAKENRDKRIGEKENKRFNQNQSINKEPIGGNNEPSCLVDCDKTTDFTEEIGLKSWKDYLDKLKVESKEAQCLLENAHKDAAFFDQNFDNFKLKLLNRAKHQPKSKHKLPQDVTNVSPQTLLMFPLR